MMTAQELAESATTSDTMPAHLSPALQALWLSKAGRWDEAHDACQHISGQVGDWIHAHLHRQEGDLSNAAYWYARAKKTEPPRTLSIEQEWRQMVETIAV